METERVQKILSNNGYCSRRAAEELIAEGKVTVNGKKIHLGDQAGPTDKIEIKGEILKRERPVYIVFHKPTGCVTALTDSHMRTIMHYIDVKERVFPVGRLDKNTSGLLLLTNDGTFSNNIMHPRYQVKKTYVVEIDAPIGPKGIMHLEKGVELDDGKTAPATVNRINSQKIEITLHEGKNRVVRRMLEALDYRVTSLHRIRIADLDIGKLKEGKYLRMHEPPITLVPLSDEEMALIPAPKLAPKKQSEKLVSTRTKQEHDERVYVDGFAYSGFQNLPAKRGGHNISKGASEQRSYDGVKGPAPARDNRGYAGARSSYGDRSSSRPSYGSRDAKPSYGDRGSKPAYGDRSSSRPSYGDRGSKPSYGSRDAKPSYGDRGSKPAYGSRDAKPSYGDRGSKPAYGDRSSSRPSYGDRGSKPSYGDRGSKPSYGGDRSSSSRPSYGSRDAKPSYGDRNSSPRPSYGGDRNSSSRPSYGDRGSKPAYGDRLSSPRPSYGDRGSKSSYGDKSSSSRPYSGNRDGKSPSFNRESRGASSSSRPSYGDRGSSKPAYGDRSSRGSARSDRPRASRSDSSARPPRSRDSKDSRDSRDSRTDGDGARKPYRASTPGGNKRLRKIQPGKKRTSNVDYANEPAGTKK